MFRLAGVSADLTFTARLFRKAPGFSSIAILSLALGIGASSAIFSLVYAVLLDPYPYKNADRLIAPTFSDRRGDEGRIWYTIEDYLTVQKSSATLEDAILFSSQPFVATRGVPEDVKGLVSCPNFFDFMGVPAMLGRTYTRNDIPVPQTPPRIAVISYLFWLRRFNRDPRAIGKSLELDHQLYTVIGVVPPRFTWTDADVYIPMPMTPGLLSPKPLMGRLKPGVSLAAASAELQAMTARFAKRLPDIYPKEFHIHVATLNHWLLGKFEGTLLILLAAVGFLLLIACGNVSILLLARANSREKEIATRISLGATRSRILQQLLTESVVLSLAGGMLGIALAYAGVPVLVSLMPEYSVPHEAAIQVNWAVLLFTFAIAVSTGILFGMAPALQLAKSDVRNAMQETGRSFAGGARAGRTRSALIVCEVALTAILLVGAGVAIRGFVVLMNTRLGFDPANVLTAYVNMPASAYGTWAAREAHFEQLRRKLQETPGVVSATATFNAVPPYMGFETAFEIPGRASDPNRMTQIGLIAGDYFATLRIPLLRGRVFSQAEIAQARRVGVINDEMLRKYWPGGNPIGMKIRIPALNFKGDSSVLIPRNAAEPVEIIGVVATARNRGLLEDSHPAIYVPWSFLAPPGAGFLIRTQTDPHKLVNAIREQVRAVDPDQPLSEIMTLDERISRFATSYPRFSTTLFSVFAAVALALAASGIYSVISYVVARRTHEFGIRMALGASAADVLALVAGMTLRLMIAGILIGLVCTLALTGVIANYVTGWNAKDPGAFIAVACILLGVGIVAAWLPTRRALRIQPMTALRHE
jgi:predicted permease